MNQRFTLLLGVTNVDAAFIVYVFEKGFMTK